MDWQLAIERNRKALGLVVAVLIAMAGRRPLSPLEGEMSANPTEGGEGDGAKAPLSALPSKSRGAGIFPARGENVCARPLLRSILRILRPAESALRRLIVVVAAMLIRTVTRGRWGAGATRPLPDFSTFNRHDPLPSFPLIDPRKRFGLAARPFGAGVPRISVPGMVDRAKPAIPDKSVDAAALLRRIRRLQYALHTLPGQARRLNRLMAKRARAGHGPGRVAPLRPGHPPGHRRRSRHPVDDILRDCHFFALRSGLKPP